MAANAMRPLLVELGTEELPVQALPGLAQALFDGVIDGLGSDNYFGTPVKLQQRILFWLARGIRLPPTPRPLFARARPPTERTSSPASSA